MSQTGQSVLIPDGIIRLRLYLDDTSTGCDPRFVWTCPNCGYTRYPGLTHGCPTAIKQIEGAGK